MCVSLYNGVRAFLLELERTYSYPHLTVRKQSVVAAVKRSITDKYFLIASFVDENYLL